MKKLDYKKEYRDLYQPGKKPVILEIPEMLFLMIEGKGNPNTSKEYKEAMEILYGLSWSIKMSKMSEDQPAGYFEYVVPPLEGFWWMKDGEFDGIHITDKEKFCWTAVIRQPEFVTEEVFQKVKGQLQHKKPGLSLKKAKLISYAEGLCVQVMHKGSYDEEPETIKRMQQFVTEQGYEEDFSQERRHHEIYLGDPRRTKSENLKTVIRHPVRKKEEEI